MADVQKLFEKSGAILNGHFLLSSGLHSPSYFEKFQVLQYPQYTVQLCKMIADHYRDRNIEVVAGPTTGGVILAFEVGRQLKVRGIFAEKEGEVRAFRRGFKISPGERVLLVDDVLTTGGSVREMVDAIAKQKGNLVGIGVLVDRSEKGADFKFPFYACLKAVPPPTYPAEKCPLCAAKIPLVKPGSS